MLLYVCGHILCAGGCTAVAKFLRYRAFLAPQISALSVAWAALGKSVGLFEGLLPAVCVAVAVHCGFMNRRCGLSVQLPPAELPSVAAGPGSIDVQHSLLPVVAWGAVPGAVMCKQTQTGVDSNHVLCCLH